MTCSNRLTVDTARSCGTFGDHLCCRGTVHCDHQTNERLIMAGITVQSIVDVNTGGQLVIGGQFAADSGASATVTVSVIAGTTLGTASVGVTGTGSFAPWGTEITALVGTWQEGTGIAVGVLLDVDDVQIGYTGYHNLHLST